MHETFPFNLNHLRYFYAVARAGNMRRAAGRIGISQPALSKQIQALEDAMGLHLFYRSSKGLSPTPEGEQVVAHCEQIFGHLYDLEETIELLRTGSAGRVSIAAIYSVAVHLLPSFIHRYHQSFPKVRLKVITDRSAKVLRSLKEHRVDVGFVVDGTDDDDLTAMHFPDSPLSVVVSPDHPFVALATHGALPVSALHRQNMVAFDADAPTRLMTERYLERHDVKPRIMAESPTIETIKRLVREELGFAVLPEHCLREEVAEHKLVTVPIAEWTLRRSLYVVHRAAPDLPPAVRHFVDLIPALARTR